MRNLGKGRAGKGDGAGAAQYGASGWSMDEPVQRAFEKNRGFISRRDGTRLS